MDARPDLSLSPVIGFWVSFFPVNLPRQFVKIRQITFYQILVNDVITHQMFLSNLLVQDANLFAPILRHWLVKITFGLNENALL
jgi:hypothetical protein